MNDMTTNYSTSAGAKVVRMRAAAFGAEKGSAQQEYMSTASRFNTVYKEAGKHPGIEFFWYENCPEQYLETRNYDPNDVRLVKPALRANGKSMDGWVAVFKKD